MTTRVLVVDDHSLFRDGVVSLLKAAGMKVVGEAGDGKAAVQEALRLKPDLVLLDIHMPEGGGLVALKEIRAQLPDTQVVMLTVSEDDDNLVEAVSSGAHGYLLKSSNAKGFLASLEGLARGEAAMTRATMTQVLQAFSQQDEVKDSKAKKKIKSDLLTEREIELLQLIARGFSNKAIAQQLHISENTVKYHMKNILQKTNFQNRTEVAAYALRNGLIKEVAEDI